MTTQSESQIRAIREILIGSTDIVPNGAEPFVGWSQVLAERISAMLDTERWVSDCCKSEQMSTAGGDGSPGSSCWVVCGACNSACEAVAIYGS